MNRSIFKDKKWLVLLFASILLMIWGVVLAIIESGVFWVGPIFFSIWMMILAIRRAQRLRERH